MAALASSKRESKGAQMGYIKGSQRGQAVLLPQSVDEYVAENNPVRAMAAFLERLNFEKWDLCAGERRIQDDLVMTRDC